jgi:hypothetical protein
MIRLLAPIVLFLLLLPVLRAEHLLDPPAVRIGEETRYLVRNSNLNSVAAMAATTVHPPAGENMEVTSSWIHYRLEDGKIVREDGFRLHPRKVGALVVKPALVEGPGVLPTSQKNFTLKVSPSVKASPAWPLLGGGLALLVCGTWFLRRRSDQDMNASLEGMAEDGDWTPEALLAPCREARMRGDARDYYIRLYAILRESIRHRSGRCPRDPKSFCEAGSQLDLQTSEVEDLRALAVLCERVVFGGEEVALNTLSESHERAETVLRALGRTPKKETLS